MKHEVLKCCPTHLVSTKNKDCHYQAKWGVRERTYVHSWKTIIKESKTIALHVYMKNTWKYKHTTKRHFNTFQYCNMFKYICQWNKILPKTYNAYKTIYRLIMICLKVTFTIMELYNRFYEPWTTRKV